jgi:dihydropyrimidinase
MNIDYNAYEGMTVKGLTETVLSRGKVIIEQGTYVCRPGEGRFLKRSTFGWK